MGKQEHLIVIGRFGRPHGVKGLISVQSFTDPKDNILSYSNWQVHIDNQWQPLNVLRIEVHNKAILVLIENFENREIAARLTNAEIAVCRDQLPELADGAFYWHELIGMNVINAEGIAFGSVIEVMPTGANDVLIVQGAKRHLIPYVPGRFILEISKENNRITVDWDVDF